MAELKDEKVGGWMGAGEPSQALWWLSGGVEKVWHRGRAYPARFSWTWTRTDGLTVALEVRMDPESGPVPVEVTIRAPEGLGSAAYRPPVASMVRVAAAEYAVTSTETAPGTFRVAPAEGPVPLGPVPSRRMTGRTDRERLERVAELYRRARAEDRGVTELIEEAEKVSRDTAYGLIKRARAAGLLAPSRPGRKRRTGDE